MRRNVLELVLVGVEEEKEKEEQEGVRNRLREPMRKQVLIQKQKPKLQEALEGGLEEKRQEETTLKRKRQKTKKK